MRFSTVCFNWHTFTPTMPFPFMKPMCSTSSPMMASVAMATRSTPRVLDTNGNERETRTLHSMTFSWSSWEQKIDEQNHEKKKYKTGKAN